MSFEISFMDALVLMPKFASTLRTLLGNKEKLTEVARTSNEPWMDECLALADLGASINLMPFSVWEKLSLPDLTPTCMTLELADRSISKPMGIAKDISVKVDIRELGANYITDGNKIDVIIWLCEEYSQEVSCFTKIIESEIPLRIMIHCCTSSPTLSSIWDSDFLLLERSRLFSLGLADDSDCPAYKFQF
ncbi:reverse transcriptase domain-containing protein [Tanacetum coccineum]|uniref:Reverse transcriptase domain-containing protein n=1 Tax=Tanacetum coccineum TaxID=301880 RepID=A0ABQ4YYN3_9ASTR